MPLITKFVWITQGLILLLTLVSAVVGHQKDRWYCQHRCCLGLILLSPWALRIDSWRYLEIQRERKGQYLCAQSKEWHERLQQCSWMIENWAIKFCHNIGTSLVEPFTFTHLEFWSPVLRTGNNRNWTEGPKPKPVLENHFSPVLPYSHSTRFRFLLFQGK